MLEQTFITETNLYFVHQPLWQNHHVYVKWKTHTNIHICTKIMPCEICYIQLVSFFMYLFEFFGISCSIIFLFYNLSACISIKQIRSLTNNSYAWFVFSKIFNGSFRIQVENFQWLNKICIFCPLFFELHAQNLSKKKIKRIENKLWLSLLNLSSIDWMAGWCV